MTELLSLEEYNRKGRADFARIRAGGRNYLLDPCIACPECGTELRTTNMGGMWGTLGQSGPLMTGVRCPACGFSGERVV